MPKLSPGILLIAFFAILMGLAAAYVVKRQLAREPVKTQVVVERPQLIPLASMDIPVGRTVTIGDLMLVPITAQQWLARHLPREVLNNPQQVLGRILKVPIAKGEAFTPDSFYPDGMSPALATRLEPGFRAVTVSVSRIEALDGQAVPGSLVDVLFRTTPVPKEEIPETTTVLLKDIKVLAIGTNSTPGLHGGIEPKATKTAVTLAVSAEQAARLLVVEGHGELSLALRPADDAMAAAEGSLTLRDVLNLPPPAPKLVPFVAEIYRGGRRQTVVFAGTQVAEESFGGLDVLPPKPKEPSPTPEPEPPTEPEPDAAPRAKPAKRWSPPSAMTLAEPLADSFR
ncbi:MAG TPA: Flp pilus assembly protein CpaB [Pirellulales bacterium]|nr:Flp pilus assembly protein CpaB [Pirellulales bacterium]